MKAKDPLRVPVGLAYSKGKKIETWSDISSSVSNLVVPGPIHSFDPWAHAHLMMEKETNWLSYPWSIPILSHLQKKSPPHLDFPERFQSLKYVWHLIIIADGQRSKVGLSWLLGLDLGSVRMWMPCVWHGMTIRGIPWYTGIPMWPMCKFRNGHLINFGFFVFFFVVF